MIIFLCEGKKGDLAIIEHPTSTNTALSSLCTRFFLFPFLFLLGLLIIKYVHDIGIVFIEWANKGSGREIE